MLSSKWKIISEQQTFETTQRQTKLLGYSVAESLLEILVPDVTGSVNRTNLIVLVVTPDSRKSGP